MCMVPQEHLYQNFNERIIDVRNISNARQTTYSICLHDLWQHLARRHFPGFNQIRFS